MKAETQIKQVVSGIEPLANFLSKFRPSCKRIHIRRADWTMLRAEPHLARTYGFVIDDERVAFREFDLLPTDCGTHHTHDGGNR